MNTEPLMGVVYINIYEDIATGTRSVNHGYHETFSAAKRAACGTCASGHRRLLAIKRVTWQEGQFDDQIAAFWEKSAKTETKATDTDARPVSVDDWFSRSDQGVTPTRSKIH